MNKPETPDTAPDATDTDTATKPDTKPEKPGQVLTIANIGPALTVFAIYVEYMDLFSYTDGIQHTRRDTRFHYYVDDVLVDRQVYMDCMETADRDRMCQCMMDAAEEEATKPRDRELS